MTPPTIALAVSGHGYGHAVRSAEVARALIERGARVVVRSDAPRSLFPAGVEWFDSPGWPLDIGVAQRDGLEMDIEATRARWREFGEAFETRATAEARLLCDVQADLVLGDVPPLAFAAAARAEVPSFGVTNFAWDWIYSMWPGFSDVVARIGSSYALADGLFRLPLHGTDPEAFPAWRCVEDVPLIARTARRPREEVRRELRLSRDATVVLISFGGFNARGLNLGGLGRWPEYVFVLTPPLEFDSAALPANVVALNESPADYVSLLAACDVVLTKPGYGIVADCLANRVSVLFTDRGPFREYDILAEALPRLGRARYVPRQDVLDMNLGPHLHALFDSDQMWQPLAMNGAEVVADRAMHRVTIKQSSLPFS